MNIQTIIDKFDKVYDFSENKTLEYDNLLTIRTFLKDSLTSMLDGIEKEVNDIKFNNYGEPRDTEYGFNNHKEEVINIINSHR